MAMPPQAAAKALAEIVEHLIVHAAGDDDRLSHLIRALDLVQDTTCSW